MDHEPKLLRVALTAALALAVAPFGAAVAHAETYEVGDGLAYAALGDVPWESLMPGDVVRIHHRAEPYREKFVLGRRGTEAMPIVVTGVPGPGGELPVIDGRDATTRTALNYWGEERGVIKIGGTSVPEDTLPAWIVIENLDIRSGREPYAFTNDAGEAAAYATNAAAIYVEKGEHIVLRNNVMHDSGNGLFIGAFDGMTQHILVEGNHIYDNGNEGRIYEHNTYTAAIDITYQHNHFGPLRAGAEGNNLKDRSAGLVVRYNWIESGNRQLDLVDAEDSAALVGHPSYGETFVYGNVLVEHEGDGNSQIVHYGGDSGTLADYRKGTLWFFHNTVVSTRDGNTTLLRLSSTDETAEVFGNVLYGTAGGDRFALSASDGVIHLSHNWIPAGFRASHDGAFAGTVDDDGTTVGGATPGFVDEAGQDYHLATDSTCRNAAAALPGALSAHPLLAQYVRHQGSETRPVDGPLDVGAFEVCPAGGCDPGTPDAGPGGDAGPVADGGTDAGTSDGGTPPPGRDSGVDDAGLVPDPGGSGGCGCAVSAPAVVPALPLVALALGLALGHRRRRRRARRRWMPW